jgi:hypothetical protein
MKLSQFYDLCDREWAKPRRGDVVSLCLTEASREKLAIDVIANGAPMGYPLLVEKSELAGIAAGAAVNTVLNPVTRTVVVIRARKGGTRDTARVRVMGGTFRQTWWPPAG